MDKFDLKHFSKETLEMMANNLYDEQLRIAVLLEAVRKELEKRNFK